MPRFVQHLRSPQRPFGWLASIGKNVFLGKRRRRLEREPTGKNAAAWIETLEDRTLLAAFDFDSNVTGSGTASMVQTVGSNTVTITASDGGNVGTAGSYTGNGATFATVAQPDTVSLLFTFNVAIAISSIELLEFNNNSTGTYAITPSSGTAITIAAGDAALSDFTQTYSTVSTPNVSDWTSVTSLTLSWSGGSGNYRIGLDNITFTDANNAPTVGGLPSDITVTEDTASDLDLSAATFADADGDALTVTLAAGTGAFAASSGGGVTIGGSGTGTLTLAGTAANINTYLDTTSNIQYTGASNVSGNDATTFTINANDGTVNPLLGTVNLDISAVNDPPTATGIPADTVVTEDTASNLDLSAVTFADVDGDALTVTLAAGAGTFAASSGGGVTVGGSGTSTLTLAGTAANINTYLDTATNIKYTGASNANGNDATTFTINANDTTVNPLLGTVNLDIVAVNDAPTATGIPSDITVTEDTASNIDLSAVTFVDVDGDALTVTLAVGAGTFAASSGGGITVGGSGTGTLTLAGTVANINTYLDTASHIQYTGASNANGNDATTFTINANDTTVNPVLGTVNLDITAVNDAPTATGIPSDITVTEDTASNLDLSAVTFADVDGDALTVSLVVGAGTFAASSGGGVTVGGSGSGTLTLAGTAANINTYLDTASNIQYTSASNANGNDATTFTINANDATVNPLLGTVNLDITAVNDIPAFANLDGDSYTYDEGDGQTIIDQGTPVTLSDVDSTDLDGGNLTVTITSGEDAAEDRLSFDTSGAISLAGTTAGSNVSVSGTVVGTLANNIAVGNDLVVNFSSDATPARIQTLARAVTYENTDTNNPTTGARNVRLTVNDGDSGTSSNQDVTITVAAIDEEPTLIATGTDPEFAEGDPAVDLFSGVTASTIEIGQAFTSMTLTVTNVADGADETLSFDGSTVQLTNGFNVASTADNHLNVTVNVVATTATVSFSGANLSEAALQTLIDGLKYGNGSMPPTATNNRVVTITELVDSGANGGMNDNTATLNVASTVTIQGGQREVNLSLNIETSAETNEAAIIVTATASGPVSGNQTVAVGVSGSGITADDGTLSSMSIVINDGQTTGTAIYTIHDDSLVEGTETAVFGISTPSPGLMLGSTTTRSVMITDDDTATVEFEFDGSTTEGESAQSIPVRVILTVSPGSTLAADLTVNVASADGSATAGIDYIAVDETLTFVAGSGSAMQTIELPILSNTDTEGNETLMLTLASPTAPLMLGTQTTHTVTISDDAYDFGDAPTAAQSGFTNSYPTLLADDGAHHKLAGPRLGATIDTENDGQPSLNAGGDGTDENGISFVNAGNQLLVSATESTSADLQIDLQNADATSNRLDAWIDFNRDGDWNDAGEQIFANHDLGTTNGPQTLTFVLPAGAEVGTSYARFRLSTVGNLSPTGVADNGEVEDYQVELTVQPDLAVPTDNVLHRSVETKTSDDQRFLLTVPQTHGVVNLSFLVTPATGSEFDPAAVQIFDAAGSEISAAFSTNNSNDGQASLVVAGVSVGQFTVVVGGNGTGAYTLEVLLAGAFDGNANTGLGSVNRDSQQQAMANIVPLSGSNTISTQLLELLAISLTVDEYVPELDANLDNRLDSTDLTAIIGNLGFTQITIDRLAAPMPIGATAMGNSAPELAAIADQIQPFNNGPVTVNLNAVDADDNLLAYSATLRDEDPYVTLARQLDQTLGLTYTGNQHRNWGGAGERWLLGDSGEWYIITPDARVRQWSGADPGEDFLATSEHVATLTPDYFANLSLIYDAAPAVETTPSGSNVNVVGDQLTVTPGTGFAGNLYVQAIVTDGYALDSQWFEVTLADAAPELDLPDQTQSQNAGPLVVDLPAEDADGETVTYTVELSAFELLATRAYDLDQQLGLRIASSDFLNWGGAGERWMRGDSDAWYFITPDGSFYRWTNASFGANFLSGSVFVATFDGSFHTDLAKLYEAPEPAQQDLQGSTAVVTGNQLVVTPGTGFLGSLKVTVTASDAHNTVADSFVLNVINHPPELNLPNVARTSGDGPLAITLPTTDADGETPNYAVSLTAVDPLAQQAYELDQELGLRLAGNEFLNWGGAGERWLRDAAGDWYFITPDGNFYRWSSSSPGADFISGSTLVATLDGRFYTDLSKITSAAEPTANDLQGSTAIITGGNQLVVTPGDNFIGQLRVRVVATDGFHTTVETFAVTVTADQAMLNAFFSSWNGQLE